MATKMNTVKCIHVYVTQKFALPQIQTSQLSLFHSETQGFWPILKVIPSNLTVKTVSLTENVEPKRPKLSLEPTITAYSTVLKVKSPFLTVLPTYVNHLYPQILHYGLIARVSHCGTGQSHCRNRLLSL